MRGIEDLVFAPWAVGVLYAASRLGIFDRLAGGGRSADEIAGEVAGSSTRCAALLDACVAMGLLERDGTRYVNSHAADSFLVRGRPRYLGDLIELQAFEAPAWVRLYETIVAGDDAAPVVPWDEFDARRFTLAMHNLAMQGEAQALATAVDLSGRRTLVDVGCGSGIYTIEMCRHVPTLSATLLDRAEVLEVARQFVRDAGLADRIRTRPTDFVTEPLGESVDVLLLSDVLYQDEATGLGILRSAHDALAEGGRLVIRGYYSDPGGAEGLFGALFVVKLLSSDPSRVPISVATLRRWLRDVGFRRVEAFALTARSTCLTADR